MCGPPIYAHSSKRTRLPLEVSRSFRAFSRSANRCPERIEPGEKARRLFDIVGLDEGTCGRRPGHRWPLGIGGSVKFMPFLNATFAAACRGGTSKCPHTQTHQFVYLCRNGSQRCRLASRHSAGSLSYINLRV